MEQQNSFWEENHLFTWGIMK